MTTTVAADLLDLSFRPDMKVLFMRWRRHTDSVTELKAGYEAALDEASAVGCGSWLVDLRRRGTLTDEAVLWFMHDFLPQAVRQIGHELRLSYLLSPNQVSSVEAREGVPVLSAEGCSIRLFVDEHKALLWLGQYPNDKA